MDDLVAGRRAVREALVAGVRVDEILVAEGERHGLEEIMGLASERGIPTRAVPKAELARIAAGVTHQSIVAIVEPYRYATFEDVAAQAEPVVVADGVVDPRNVGALLRAIEAAGAAGLIIGEHRASGVTPAARKAAAGAAEHVAVARVTNISRTLEALKSRGRWVVGLDQAGPIDLYDADLEGPLALVVGAEGTGLSRLVKEHCDYLVSIPMAGKVASLNVAQAAAVTLFEWRRRQRGA